MPQSNGGVTNTYLEKGDKIMMNNPDEFGNILSDDLFNRSLTRVQLQALITASALIIGQKYTITNAVGSTLSLVCTGISTSKLSELAVDSATGDIYNYDITTDLATSGIDISLLDLDPQTAPTYRRGRVWYDSTSETLSYYDDITGTSIQVGQEEVIKVRNSTGGTITNGTVVYINGATGQNPTIAKALSNADGTSNVIGIATHDIANNSVGKVTTSGLVNDVDTSAFADGALLYLSSSVAGGLTSTKPSAPNFAVLVGVCLHSHVSQGKIYVHPDKQGLGLGSANQLLGVNSGAAGEEYKTLSSDDTSIILTNTTNKIDFKINQAISVTKSQLDALILANGLIPYQKYLLTDATTQNISLLLTAKDNNELFKQCQIVDDNFDIMEYNISTDVFTGIDNLSVVCRNTSGTWAIINDSDHKPRNIASVETTTNELKINYTRTDYTKVLALNATPDEAYVLTGVNCGASVGKTFSLVSLSRMDSMYGKIYYTGSAWAKQYDRNIGLITFDGSGTLTINHENFGVFFPVSIVGKNGTYLPQFYAGSATTTQIRFYDYAGTLITTPNINMEVMFMQILNRQLTSSEAGYTGSNIWVNGQMMKEIV